MFRFFNKKDDGAKNGPPGHRGSQAAASDDAAAVGGGFFNLPPPVAKHPMGVGAASPAPHAAPSSYSRPTALPGAYQQPPPAPHQQPPAYNHSSSYEAPMGNGAPAAPLDMFGGMAIKNPPAAAAMVAAPTGGSLFSGLDLAAGGLSTSHEDTSYQQPPHASVSMAHADRRKSATRSFNYLDVAATTATTTTTSSTLADTTTSRTSSNASGGGARSVSKVVKKKKTKSFRPGFGRQLSDESVAALQRGDLKEEDIIQTGPGVGDDSAPVARPASNPNDLAHLLPPVGAGSVLSGLTVHKTTSSTAGGGGGSVLAGLTVHAGASSPRNSARKDSGASSPRGEVSGSVLAGLNVHHSKSNSSLKRESSRLDSATSREHAPSSVSAGPEEKAAPAVPAAPAAPPTPEERLLNTLRDFHASAVSFRENVLKQNDEENRILERKVYLANQLTQYEIDLRDVEAQQHHACEVEDFERADALNATINSVRHCITLTESDVRKVDSELASFVKAKEKAFANQLRSTRGTLRELEKFREDQESERANMRNEFKDFEVKETEQLQFEAERIDTEMHHVSANLEHLAAEKSEIESTIDEQCKDEFVVRAQLLEERASVEEEVRELERKLKLKLERVREIQESINKAEKDIDVVRNRYSRQLKRIADRESGILKTKSEVESDVEQLKAQKKEFHEKIQGYETNIATFGKRIVSVRKEMRAAALLASVLEVQETRREQSLMRKKQQTAELSSLSDAAAIAEQSFVMLRKQHDELEKSLSIHRNAIASAESLIPRLEGEKKTAAAQRNFKEAARISKDIKALEKDRATAEEMVEVVEMELQDLKERIDKREVEFEEKKNELKAVEKQLELTTLQELWKEAKHLRVSIRKMEKFKSEGIAAESGIDFRSSALLLVQAELEACSIQVEALEHKYDVSDPNKDQEDDADDDDDDDDISDDDETDIVRNSVAITHAVANGNVASDAVEAGEVDVDAIGDGSSALDEIASKLSELEVLIEKATENEEYELAARLDEKIEVLKRRQHSIVALASLEVPGETAPEEDEEEEEEEEEDHHQEQYQAVEQHYEGHFAAVAASSHESEHEHKNEHKHASHDDQNIEELTEELEALRQRIIHVEDDIDIATQNEEYESAAAFDEELQELRAEQEEIQQLLEAARQRSSGSSQPAEPQASSSSGLFMGLGVKQPSLEGDSGASASVTRKTSNESAKTAVTDGSSIFGGLEMSSSTSPRRLSKPPSPIETAVLLSDEVPVPVVVAVESVVTAAAVVASDPVNSPTADSQVGPDSFFGALRSTDAPLPSPSTSMFGGLQLSASVLPSSSPASSTMTSEETSQSVFNGLTITQTVTEVVHTEEEQQVQQQQEGEVAMEELSSKSVHSAEPTPTGNAMFAGLHVSVSSSTGHESQVHSRSGSASSLIDDEHSTDSPMTIHELSDHTAATDDESLSGSLVSHESSFADISFTSTSLTAVTTSTTVATTPVTTMTASDSLFGGLSLMQPAPVPAALAGVPGVETDDEDTFDDAKQEL